MPSRLDGASKPHRALEKEVNCSGKEGKVTHYMPGYVSLEKNYMVPTDSPTWRFICTSSRAINDFLSIMRRLAGFLGRGSCRLQLVLESSCGYGT